MAFLHGKSTMVMYGGSNLSAYFNEASQSQSVETAETTAFGDNAKTYITGLKDGTFSLSGMFDGAQDAVDDVLSSVLGSATHQPLTIAPKGTAVGDVSFSGDTIQTSYEVSSPVGDVVSVSMESQVSSGIDRGLLLAAQAAVSATGNQSSIDNSTSSSNGAVGYLHLTANGQDGATTVKIQHSADNSTFADLITFTAVSAGSTAGERIEVTGTVNRYVRAQYTLAGTGSVTITVAFSRK